MMQPGRVRTLMIARGPRTLMLQFVRMAEEKHDLRMEKAIEEFQEYLSDLLPPLVVSDSLRFLMSYPDISAANVYSWVNGQLRSMRANSSMTDYFFHALKKIHLMGEYHLLPKNELLEF